MRTPGRDLVLSMSVRSGRSMDPLPNMLHLNLESPLRSHFGCKLTCSTNETTARVRQSPGRLHHPRFFILTILGFGLLTPRASVQVVRIQVVSISTFLNTILQNHLCVHGIAGKWSRLVCLAAELRQNPSAKTKRGNNLICVVGIVVGAF